MDLDPGVHRRRYHTGHIDTLRDLCCWTVYCYPDVEYITAGGSPSSSSLVAAPSPSSCRPGMVMRSICMEWIHLQTSW